MRSFLVFCTSLLLAAPLAAAPQVQVVGLFPGAAVVSVDGQRQLLKVGQSGPAGVTLVSADARGAVLRVEGAERPFGLSREYSGTGYAEPQRQQMSIARRGDGHYWSAGSINGQGVQFLVDTGASSVAMNEAQASRLGLDYKTRGQPMQVNTAGGVVPAWSMRLNSVKVGTIELLGVEAAIVAGGSPTEVLLGMSFLNRVGWREEQGLLRLEAKH
ncbi:TIGR02281 family clan AA aspartic protease [Pseudomonas sp. MAP12]|uniref:TIGR02281 family clan AA aspartic protease n=1 Tax=Geopseudomonas aromaticivorans TaxID=2849492 RepID=A0ABS6N1A3_9GAMM|nr:TIGR02281 family clan AA aspartic protease [Pseudomonas aromaticivorans]MBV2134819.1 TIGR02281 family clan AA aspartic protease [Pseudomonas aromaticivorans]